MPARTPGPPVRIALSSRPPVALLDRALVRLLPAVPRPVVQRLSSRYIAGPTLDDALRVVRKLNAKGKLATIDVLGEEITSPDEARAIAGQYHDVLARDRRGRARRERLGEADRSRARARSRPVPREPRGGRRRRRRARQLRADRHGGLVDDRPHARALPRAARGGHDRTLGVVLQAYLRRTLDDVDGLDNVRLCKGIYVEPVEIAYKEFEAVRANYVRVPRAARRARGSTSGSRRTTST